MAIKRLRYFDHQFLVEGDFTDEQKYHLEMRRRLNRVLHTFGIAEGLQVVKKTNKIVTVRPGVAIDNLGREIILEADQDVDLNAITTAIPVFITIAYTEKQDDPSTATGTEGINTRFTEEPRLDAVTTPPPTNGSVIRLALINLTTGGNVPGNPNDAFDGGVRQTAGPRGERGLASIDGISNPGGDVDLVAGAGITITPDQASRRVIFSTQGLASLENVSNPGGNIDLVPGGAIQITTNAAASQINIGENHSTQIGNVHGLTAANLQTIGALLASQYDLRQRTQASFSIGQTPGGTAPASGPRIVNVSFQPRFIFALSSLFVVLGGRQFGGLTTGFFDQASGIQHGQQLVITLINSATDFIMNGTLSGLLCVGSFTDVIGLNPRPSEQLSLSITGTSATNITLQFNRTVPANSVSLNNFSISLSMLIMG